MLTINGTNYGNTLLYSLCEKENFKFKLIRCFSGAISKRRIVYMSVVFNFSVYSYLRVNERPNTLVFSTWSFIESQIRVYGKIENNTLN